MSRRNYWAFQANPRIYDIERAVMDLPYDTWTTKRSDVRVGDRALIWKSGGGTSLRGIVALAEVLDDPAPLDPDSTYWIGASVRKRELRVPIRYVLPEGCPLWVTEHTRHVLETLSVSKAQGTVFRVTPEQWQAVLALIGGWPDSVEAELDEIAASLPDDLALETDTAPDARRRIMRSVVVRRGQPAFRNALMEAYGGACAISGCTVRAVLEAAHILPYRGPHTNEVSNGLLLRADLHTLFDLGLISIDPETFRVLVAPSMDESEYASLTGRRLRMPDRPEWRPNPAALEAHRRRSTVD